MWTEDRVLNLGEDLENHHVGAQSWLTALPHPIQAPIPEIPGPLGHRQPPAEGAS